MVECLNKNVISFEDMIMQFDLLKEKREKNVSPQIYPSSFHLHNGKGRALSDSL